MWILVLLTLLVGMVLGQRFTVLIMVPLSFIALVATFGLQAWFGDGLWPAIVAAALVVASLHIGYMMGIAVRHTLIVVRARRLRPLSLTTERTSFRAPPGRLAD